MTRYVLLLGCLVLLSGCDQLPFGYTPIGDIVRNPGQYEEQTVKVRGEVTELTKIPFLELKSYTLRDDSGEIVVQTSGALPALQKKVTIRAQVKTVAIIDGTSFGLRLVPVE